MPAPFLSTYQDIVDFCVIQSRGGGSDVEQRDVRAAAFLAYQKLGGIHDWQFYRKIHRVQLEGSYSTGTVAYDHTGGTYERQLTLTTGTWPSWAASGRLIIDDVVYEVERRISDSVVTLDATFTPQADITAGETYTLIRTSYDMPWDFRGSWEGVDENAYQPHYVSPEEWNAVDRIYPTTTSVWYFTILPSVDAYATWRLVVHGYPSTDETLDFLYQGRPRPIRYTGYETKCRGTFAATAGAATVTGSGTSFDSTMIGSIFRTSTTSTAPTGIYDLNPWNEQKTIVSVTSTTVLTVDTVFSDTYSADAFVISDPLDIDENLNQALIALTRAELSKIRTAETWPKDDDFAMRAVRMAMECEPRPKHARWSSSVWSPPMSGTSFDHATISNS